MIEYRKITDVHLELSTLCNASCPRCPRNFYGYPFNNGYPETNLTLEQSQIIFSKEFLEQLTSIRINGNFGDIVMNPETVDIINYFKSVNPNLLVTISTNGAARDLEFWKRLAELKTHIYFCIDGLEDTHSIYRQNTVWSTIIKNAKTFIQSGGYAIWKFIPFKHNRHQILACYNMSKDLGFQRFECVDQGRDIKVVYNRHGDLINTRKGYQGETNFLVNFNKRKTDLVLVEDIPMNKPIKISCDAINRKSIYISATGDVSPCCWTGFYPATYGKGEYWQAINSQLKPLISKNNALKYPISECISWFNLIKESWEQDSHQSGRLLVCDDNCGMG